MPSHRVRLTILRLKTISGLRKTLQVGAWLSLATMSAWGQNIHDVVAIDIAEQPLGRALTSLAEQTGMQILFAEGIVKGHQSRPITGRYSAVSALDLLLEDVELRYSIEGRATIVISEPCPPTREKAAAGSTTHSSHNDTRGSMKSTTNKIECAPKATSGRLFLLGALMAGVGASAQAAPQLEEVIVTAQKRAQNLQDVPVAVSAVSGEKIEAMGIGRLEELTAYTPGVSNTEAATGAFLYIRGVGSGGNKGFEQSVGTYIDGVYYGRDRSSRNGMFDLQMVEILKGPQGILFGKNTIAGAITMTTRGPTAEPEGYVKLGYEVETKEKVVEAAYGGMLTDTFGARLAVRHAEMDGWMKNTWNGQNIGEEDDIVARLSTLWEPTANLEMTGKLTYSRLRQNEKNAQLTHCSPDLLEQVAGIDDCRLNSKTTVTAYNRYDGGFGFEELEAWSAGWTINWDIGSHVLTSVTGYTKHTDDMFLDSDYTHLEVLEAVRDEEYESYSQEFRIASTGGGAIEYIAGVYFEKSDMDFTANLGMDLNSRGLPVRDGRAKLTSQETESQAIFGQLTWHINEAFSATVGGRYSKDEKDASANNFCTFYKTFIPTGQPACALGPGFVLKGSRRDENFSPSVILEWRPLDNHMLYAKYSQGYKSGGFDLQTNSPEVDPFSFAPEEVDSLEIGSKSTLLNGAMTLNVALFRNEYKDLQVSTFDGNIGFLVGNAAEAISQGAEVDVNWALTNSLRTAFSVSYLDATYDKFATAQCTFPQNAATPPGEICVNDLSGKSLQYSPDISAHWNLTWDRVLADNYLLTVATDVIYSDEYYTANDLDRHFLEDSYYKVDARISLESFSSGWELALVARNLNNEKTSHYGDDVPLSPGSYFKHLDKPRTVALQARWSF